MGDTKKRRKLYRRPKKPFDKPRIEQEEKIKTKYGLKNKKEIWKAESLISIMRRQAKELINETDEERKEFFDKLNKMGLKINEISDVLALTKEDLLNRRLQTVVFKKGLANTPKQARQFIVHKLVLVNDVLVNSPSTIVPLDMENKIKLKEKNSLKDVPKTETKLEVAQNG